MEIKGTVIQLLKLEEGMGAKGQWRKQPFILETDGQYAKKICISAWNSKIDEFNLAVGNKVNAYIEIESREHNGRWYTEVRAWKLDKNGYSAPSQQQQRAQSPTQQNTPPPAVVDDSSLLF